jgi:uncharacterized linocin/CFP29 family protein
MADSQLGWTDAQWETVNGTVTEAFEKANVAEQFVTRRGPLSDSQEYVRDEQFDADAMDETVRVKDDTTLKLLNLTVKVELSSEQVADKALSTALMAFQRAANTLAQVEDDLVFNGFQIKDVKVARTEKTEDLKNATRAAELKMKEALAQLREAAPHADKDAKESKAKAFQTEDEKLRTAEQNEREHRTALILTNPPPKKSDGTPTTFPGLVERTHVTSVNELRAHGKDVGEDLVNAVVIAIAHLEDQSHPGPFACVLGSNVFAEAYRPVEKSLALPADRITPLLNGPLLRSGQMDKDKGIVVSLAGSDVDLVVATPPKVQFLQINSDAKYVFRVYEKIVLRIKDKTAISQLKLD